MRSPVSRTLEPTVGEVVFGPPGGHRPGERPASGQSVPLVVLAGDPRETLLTGAESVSTEEGFVLSHAPGGLAGYAAAAPGLDLEAATRDLYRKLFKVSRGIHLYRIWNYVPQINVVCEGLENYQRFCRGRSLTFEENFGRAFQDRLPAGSAVGTTGGSLIVCFVAGQAKPRYFENPRQVPAFEYPPDYGPRPPSFSRAALVQTGRTIRLFVSGTAAIRGHATVAPGQLEAQLKCTLENLRAIGESSGLGPVFGHGEPWTRSFKVYVRHPADLPAVIAAFAELPLRPADRVLYLQADICRSDLVLEIEAELTRPAPSGS